MTSHLGCAGARPRLGLSGIRLRSDLPGGPSRYRRDTLRIRLGGSARLVKGSDEKDWPGGHAPGLQAVLNEQTISTAGVARTEIETVTHDAGAGLLVPADDEPAPELSIVIPA